MPVPPPAHPALFQHTPLHPRTATQTRTALHSALRLARTHRRVADFLFARLSAPFHDAHALSDAPDPAAVAFRACHQFAIPASARQADARSAVEVAFVPVAGGGIMLGYSFTMREGEGKGAQGGVVGRFAFDIRCGELVKVEKEGGLVKVGAMQWKGGACREQWNFVVPGEEYGAGRLPETVLGMLSNVEYRLDNVSRAVGGGAPGKADWRRWSLPPPPPPPPPPSRLLPLVSTEELGRGSSGAACSIDRASRTVQGSRECSPGVAVDALAERHDTSSFLSELLGGSRDGELADVRLDGVLEFHVDGAADAARQVAKSLPPAACARPGQSTAMSDESRHRMQTSQALTRRNAVRASSAPCARLGDGVPVNSSAAPSVTANGSAFYDGALWVRNMRAGVSALERAVIGKFYGPSVRMDSYHVLSGHFVSMFSGTVSYTLECAAPSVTEILRKAFAQTQCLAALAVATDNILMVDAPSVDNLSAEAAVGDGDDEWADAVWWPGADMGRLGTLGFSVSTVNTNTSSLHREVVPNAVGETGYSSSLFTTSRAGVQYHAGAQLYSGQRSGASEQQTGFLSTLIPIAPKPSPQATDVNDLCPQQANGQQQAVRIGRTKPIRSRPSLDKSRKQILEERKKRNRQSAARSNFRKLEHQRVVQLEIVDNRNRMLVLEERKRDLMIENQRLRRLANS